MANPLTGNCEAIVQISTRLIDGLLGTIHQNGLGDTAPLRLAHSANFRIGDPRPPRPDLADFEDWVVGFKRSRGSGGIGDIRGHLLESAPPGAARVLRRVFDDVLFPGEFEVPPEIVRGTVRAQLGAPTVTLVPSSSQEVVLHVQVRAEYTPDAGTTPLPAPLHGEAQVTLEIRQQRTGSRTRLVVRPSADDGKIRFTPAPGSGLDPVESAAVEAQVRKAVRVNFSTEPIDLPADFPFTEFKAFGAVPFQAIGVAVALSGTPPPPGAIQSASTPFIGSSSFAFAVAREFVDGLLDVNAIRDAIASKPLVLRVSALGFTASVTYRLRFSEGPKLTWRDGAIDVSGRVEAETSTWWAPNGFVSFKQALGLILRVGSQQVSLRRLGEPDVDESFFIPHNTAVNVVKTEIAAAVDAANATVRETFNDARATLVGALRDFDPAMDARYADVTITPDGVIARGEAGGGFRLGPILSIDESDDRTMLSAQESWIAGGHVDRFLWSWVEFAGPTPWSGEVRSLLDEHTFTFPKPAAVSDASQICLRIEGIQRRSDGQRGPVGGGRICAVPGLPEVFEMPRWFPPVTVPVWQPDVPASAVLRDVISGHVSVQADTQLKGEPGVNALVYFADWKGDRPLEILDRTLETLGRRSASLVAIVVLPKGTFDMRRREFEARLDPGFGKAGARVVFTEDDENGWSQAFDAKRMPSAFLLDTRRDFVWGSGDTLTAGELAGALQKHMRPAPAVRFKRVRLAVNAGDRAPDFLFAKSEGEQAALHRLRGRRVVLAFWQSWSAPCLRELDRLRHAHEEARDNPPAMIALHGGSDDAASLLETQKRLRLPFELVPDERQRVAGVYGVRCWPTTVTLNEDGIIEDVQVGAAAPERERKSAAGEEPR